MSREAPQFEDIHDELISNYLEKYPAADYQQASEATAEAAYAAWVDSYAAAVDAAYERARDERLEAND